MIRNILAFACFTLSLAAQVQVSGPSRLGQTDTWVVSFRWTAASDGTVPTTQAPSQAVQGFRIAQVEIQPLTPAPTTNYNVQILDTAGVDVLAGQANSLSSTASYNYSVGSSAVFGNFSLAVGGNAVAGAKGAVFVYLNNAPSSFVLPTSTNSSSTTTSSNGPFVQANLYTFSQSPSSSIAVGSNTLTMRPCPAGVGGADTAHYVYLSGGSGTAEAVLITGGTCTTSAPVGTIIFTAVSAHSGAWSITSATAGIQEAANVAVAQGLTSSSVFCPNGTYRLKAPVRLSGVGITGASTQSVNIVQDYTTGHAFTVTGPNMVEVSHMNFGASVTVVAPYYFINAVSVSINIHDVLFLGGYGDILFDAVPRGYARTLQVAGYTRGIQIGGDTGASGITISDVIGSTATVNAIGVYAVSGLFDLSNFNFQDAALSGGIGQIVIAPGAGQGVGESTITNGTLDGGWVAALRFLVNATGSCFGFTFSNLMFTGGSNPDHIGIATDARCQNMQFSNIQMRGVGSSTAPAVLLIGGGIASSITFDALTIGDFTIAGTTAMEVGLGGVVKGFSLTGSRIGYTSAGAQDPNSAYAVDLQSVATTDLNMTGNALYGATATLNNVPTTKTRWAIQSNVGLDDVIPAVASAGTIAAPVNSTFTITGTTSVTAITGFWTGRTIRVLYPTGAGITVMGFTLVAGQSVTLTSTGVSSATWY